MELIIHRVNKIKDLKEQTELNRSQLNLLNSQINGIKGKSLYIAKFTDDFEKVISMENSSSIGLVQNKNN